MTRHIPLAGAPNVRDLGGYTTTDGRTVAYDRLFRAGALNALTDDDLAVLAKLNLATVVDFRTPGEVHAAGSDRLPDGVAPTLLPVGGGDLDRYYNAATDPVAQEQLLGGGRAALALADINRGFVANDGEREQFGAAVRLIADAKNLPLLFHCTAGKDRTGWLAAIVLAILGVPHETIVEDYLLSNAYFLPVGERLLAKLATSGLDVDPALFRPLLEQHPDYLQTAFDEATTRYGTFDAFLHDGLDLDDATLDQVRTILLDSNRRPRSTRVSEWRGLC